MAELVNQELPLGATPPAVARGVKATITITERPEFIDVTALGGDPALVQGRSEFDWSVDVEPQLIPGRHPNHVALSNGHIGHGTTFFYDTADRAARMALALWEQQQLHPVVQTVQHLTVLQ